MVAAAQPRTCTGRGRRPGRTSDAQISVADLCGLGVQDAAIAELVASGTERAAHFSMTRLAEAYLAIYREIAGS